MSDALTLKMLERTAKSQLEIRLQASPEDPWHINPNEALGISARNPVSSAFIWL